MHPVFLVDWVVVTRGGEDGGNNGEGKKIPVEGLDRQPLGVSGQGMNEGRSSRVGGRRREMRHSICRRAKSKSSIFDQQI